MLFALQRDAAGGEQHADEHQRDADGDHDRERVERRAAAVQQRAVDGDRLADRRRAPSSESVRFWAAKVGEGERSVRAPRGRGRAADGRSRRAAARDLTEADQVCGRAEHAEVAALQAAAPIACAAALLDLFGEAEVRLRERGIRAWTARATARARRRCRALRDAPGETSEESRAAMSWGITTAASTSPDWIFATACARVAVGTASTWSKSCSAYSPTSTLRPPTWTVCPGRGFVDDRDARLGGAAREREPDQQRDRDRVEHEQRDHQARAARGSAGPCAAASASIAVPVLARAQERDEARPRSRRPARRPRARSSRGCRRTAAARRRARARARRSAAPRRRRVWRTATLVPSAARPRMKLHSRSRWPGSSAVEGSSSASTGGSREQADRDVHALAVAAGEARELLRGALAQAGLLEHPLDRRGGVGDALQAGEQARGSRRPRASSRAPAAGAPSRLRRGRRG